MNRAPRWGLHLNAGLAAFIVSLVASTSLTAAAGVTRIATASAAGAGPGDQIGSIGCREVISDLQPTTSNQYICVFPELLTDLNPLTSYVGGNAFFAATWSSVQNIYACVSFAVGTATACTQSTGSCAGNGSACQVFFDPTAWNNNLGMFKYLVFENITAAGRSFPASQLSGYTVVSSP